MQAGSFVPEVTLDNPEALKQAYRDYMNAGSDVVLAFTYNAHREKMRIIGKEDLLEPLNRNAIRLAREVAKYHNRYELADWTKEAKNIGLNHIGLCCGASPAMLRAVAEAVGVEAVNSKYPPDMEKHFLFGIDETLKKHNLDYRLKA